MYSSYKDFRFYNVQSDAHAYNLVSIPNLYYNPDIHIYHFYLQYLDIHTGLYP